MMCLINGHRFQNVLKILSILKIKGFMLLTQTLFDCKTFRTAWCIFFKHYKEEKSYII